jgi:hypothetical protein
MALALTGQPFPYDIRPAQKANPERFADWVQQCHVKLVIITVSETMRCAVLVQFPTNVCLAAKIIFSVLCRQDLRPERWNGHCFFGQQSELNWFFLIFCANSMPRIVKRSCVEAGSVIQAAQVCTRTARMTLSKVSAV